MIPISTPVFTSESRSLQSVQKKIPHGLMHPSPASIQYHASSRSHSASLAFHFPSYGIFAHRIDAVPYPGPLNFWTCVRAISTRRTSNSPRFCSLDRQIAPTQCNSQGFTIPVRVVPDVGDVYVPKNPRAARFEVSPSQTRYLDDERLITDHIHSLQQEY